MDECEMAVSWRPAVRQLIGCFACLLTHLELLLLLVLLITALGVIHLSLMSGIMGVDQMDGTVYARSSVIGGEWYRSRLT